MELIEKKCSKRHNKMRIRVYKDFGIPGQAIKKIALSDTMKIKKLTCTDISNKDISFKKGEITSELINKYVDEYCGKVTLKEEFDTRNFDISTSLIRDIPVLLVRTTSTTSDAQMNDFERLLEKTLDIVPRKHYYWLKDEKEDNKHITKTFKILDPNRKNQYSLMYQLSRIPGSSFFAKIYNRNGKRTDINLRETTMEQFYKICKSHKAFQVYLVGTYKKVFLEILEEILEEDEIIKEEGEEAGTCVSITYDKYKDFDAGEYMQQAARFFIKCDHDQKSI